MDSKFLFGIETEEKDEKSGIPLQSSEEKEMLKNIKEEVELAESQFSTLQQQVSRNGRKYNVN